MNKRTHYFNGMDSQIARNFRDLESLSGMIGKITS